MSLLNQASPWTSETAMGKKRKPIMLKTYEKTLLHNSDINEDEPIMTPSLVTSIEPKTLPPSFVAPDQAGSNLTPYLSKIKEEQSVIPLPSAIDNRPDTTSNRVSKIESFYQMNPNSYQGNTSSGTSYSNSYELTPFYKGLMSNQNGKNESPVHSQLMEKLNYMIYLLEEQQKEPTEHIMEEFVLYTLLGVFVIYLVDSFSRGGKYVR